jgi:putative Ca2+/H+ antiporter (TMEM165/GDT1 family)
MEAFLVSLTTIALAEMGDRTQVLTLLLATRFRQHWQVIGAIFLATLVSNAAAGVVGVGMGKYLTPTILDAIVGASMLVMAVWTLMPEKSDGETADGGQNAFVATFVAFLIAELGDKTQIATVALAAGFSNLPAVVAGTTLGMMAANIPVVFAGKYFADRLPIRLISRLAAAVFLVLALVFIVRAARHWNGA